MMNMGGSFDVSDFGPGSSSSTLGPLSQLSESVNKMDPLGAIEKSLKDPMGPLKDPMGPPAPNNPVNNTSPNTSPSQNATTNSTSGLNTSQVRALSPVLDQWRLQ